MIFANNPDEPPDSWISAEQALGEFQRTGSLNPQGANTSDPIAEALSEALGAPSGPGMEALEDVLGTASARQRVANREREQRAHALRQAGFDEHGRKVNVQTGRPLPVDPTQGAGNARRVSGEEALEEALRDALRF